MYKFTKGIDLENPSNFVPIGLNKNNFSIVIPSGKTRLILPENILTWTGIGLLPIIGPISNLTTSGYKFEVTYVIIFYYSILEDKISIIIIF